MNGKKLLLQKLMLLLLLLVVVAAGAAVSFGMKNKSAKDDGNAASKGTTASSASGTASGEMNGLHKIRCGRKHQGNHGGNHPEAPVRWIRYPGSE